MVGQQQSERPVEESALAALRQLVPRRPLRYPEALRIAELQAARLLALARVEQAPVPTEFMLRLPRIEVVFADDSPVAGSAHWDGHDWIVVLNGRKRIAARRYSLAHELKHVIDHTTRGLLYRGMPRLSAVEQAERAADFFADCLLMPAAWVEAASADGCRTAAEYAQRFHVPVGAATRRLSHLGLAPERSRQIPLQLDGSTPEVSPLLPDALGAEA